MDAAGVSMPVFFYATIPSDEAGCRKVFEFGRKLGIETFISEPPPESLDVIERFCDEYDIRLAIHNHGPEQLADLLATGRCPGGLPGTQQTDRGLPRHGLLDPRRHRSDRGRS